MAIKTNTFEGGTSGSNLTVAGSGGASGDAFQILVINNASTPGGSTAVQYQSGAAINGSMGLRYTPAAAATYVRWDETTTATRYVMRMGFTYPGAPSATADLMVMRHASGALAAVRIATDGKPLYTIGTTDNNLSKPASALTAGTDYFIELAVTLETGGGGNGVVAFRLLSTAESQIHTHSSTSQATGTAPATQYRLGGVISTSGWTAVDMDSVAAGDLASGWIGPVANQPPTGTITANQNVAASAAVTATVTASDSDGSIASYAWSVVTARSTSSPPLTNGTTATVSLTAPAAGNLVTLQCIVTDNGGATTPFTTEVRVPLAGSSAVVPLALNGTAVGTWTNVGGAATLGAAFADASDSTYGETGPLSGTEQSYQFRWQPVGTKSSGQLTPVRLGTDTGTANAVVRLVEGTTVRQTWNQAVTGAATDYTFTLDPATISAITDWSNLFCRVGFTT